MLTLLLLAEIVVQYGLARELPLLQSFTPVGYYGPLVMLATVGVFLTCRGSLGPRVARVIRTLSDASFGVYLVHFTLIVAAVAFIPGLRDALGRSLWAAGGLFLAVLVTSFAMSVAARRVPYLRRLF